jgi:hypothetical protein
MPVRIDGEIQSALTETRSDSSVVVEGAQSTVVQQVVDAAVVNVLTAPVPIIEVGVMGPQGPEREYSPLNAVWFSVEVTGVNANGYPTQISREGEDQNGDTVTWVTDITYEVGTDRPEVLVHTITQGLDTRVVTETISYAGAFPSTVVT